MWNAQPDYQFQKQEFRELIGFTDDIQLTEIEDLLVQAEAWLIETEGEKTLMRFLCQIQNKLVHEPEVDFLSAAMQDTEDGYDYDGFYDVTRTKAHRGELQRKQEAECQALPDSGREYLERPLKWLRLIDAGSR